MNQILTWLNILKRVAKTLFWFLNFPAMIIAVFLNLIHVKWGHMKFKQETIGDIIQSEGDMILHGAGRFGDYFINAS